MKKNSKILFLNYLTEKLVNQEINFAYILKKKKKLKLTETENQLIFLN